MVLPRNLSLQVKNKLQNRNSFIFHLTIKSNSFGIGLVDGRDLVVIAANLQKLLDGLPAMTCCTFALVNKDKMLIFD